jgi:hypothetical protein
MNLKQSWTHNFVTLFEPFCSAALAISGHNQAKIQLIGHFVLILIPLIGEHIFWLYIIDSKNFKYKLNFFARTPRAVAVARLGWGARKWDFWVGPSSV